MGVDLIRLPVLPAPCVPYNHCEIIQCINNWHTKLSLQHGRSSRKTRRDKLWLLSAEEWCYRRCQIITMQSYLLYGMSGSRFEKAQRYRVSCLQVRFFLWRSIMMGRPTIFLLYALITLISWNIITTYCLFQVIHTFLGEVSPGAVFEG